MQSRETRFYLRIESGDQLGDEVPLQSGATRLGRRPDNTVVLKDGSVSGHHAEVRVSGEEAVLVDLGSTNGTKIGGQKVEQARLAHGDVVLLGNVRFSFCDARLGGPSAAADGGTRPALAPSPAPESALERVSAEKVSRSAASSRRGAWILGVLFLAAVGLAAWRWLGRERRSSAQVSVPSVPGNLLSDASFEEGTAEWTSSESAPQAFLRQRTAAFSGQFGLGVDLIEGEWSLARSSELELRPRRRVELAAQLSVSGASGGRVGLELASADGSAPEFIAWAPALQAAEDSVRVSLAFDTLGGYDRGRLVVAGREAGNVGLDDASVVLTDPAQDAARFNEYELAVLGEQGSTAVLVRSGRVLLSGIGFGPWDRSGLQGWGGARLEARATERGFTLAFPGAPADAVLVLWAIRADPGEETGWLSTTGPEGYAAHAAEFTRSGVTNLLLGRGLELLRIGFAQPVEVESATAPGALRLRVATGGQGECEFQLTFREERVEAGALSDRAEELEREEDPGGALASWTELLDRFPFERALVTKAEEARARLVRTGLEQVDDVRRGLQQAQFFALPELFREGRERALLLARAYHGSEVEVEARAAAEEALRAVEGLSSGRRAGETQLLGEVLEALDPQRSPRLLEHVRAALEAVDQPAQER